MGEMSLRQALEQYQAIHMPARNLAPRTRAEYLAELEPRGLSGATRKRKTIAIRSWLTFLYRQDFIASDLATRVIPPFADNPNPRFLTKPEYQRLLQAAGGNIRDRAIIELLLQTGIRLSELTRLTVDDIELPQDIKPSTRKTGLVRIDGLNGRKGRAIPLNFKACVALSDYLNCRPEAQVSALFLNRFRKPLGGRGVQKMLYKYVQAAGVWGALVHSLRHTFGTHHAAKGTSLKSIQEVMGHQDIRTTQVYASIAQEVVGKELQENAL